MLQCTADDCERSQVRTRPHPETGEPARWCMFHPDAPPPELDVKGKPKAKAKAAAAAAERTAPVYPPVLSAQSNPVADAAGRATRARARRHAEIPEEFVGRAKEIAQDLTDGPLAGTGLTAEWDLEPVVRDVEVVPLPDGTDVVIGADRPVTPQPVVGPSDPVTPESPFEGNEVHGLTERIDGEVPPELAAHLHREGYHPPPYGDVPLTGYSMGYPVRITDPELYRLQRDNPIRLPSAFVTLALEDEPAPPFVGYAVGHPGDYPVRDLERHAPKGDPCEACQRPRGEHLAPREPLRVEGPTVTLTAEEYRAIIRGLGIGPAREDEQPAATAPRAGLPWRQGRQVGRTLYGATDELLGVMDSPGLAASVVEAVNAHVPAKIAADRQAHAAPLERLLTAIDDAAEVALDDTMTEAVRQAAAKLDECLTALFYATTVPADAPVQPATRRRHNITEEGRRRMRENGLRLAARNRELREARDQ